MAHNFIKVLLVQFLAITNIYDLICLTETVSRLKMIMTEYPFQDIILHVYIDLLAKHPRNLRISVKTLTYSCQILMISIQHVLL